MYREPVVRLAPTVTSDPYSGEPSYSWAAVSRTPLSCLVAPATGSTTVQSDRVPVDSDFALYFDSDPGIEPHHRVEVRGLVCRVSGRPGEWRWPGSGQPAGWVVAVKVREG